MRLCVLDCETTGLDENAQFVELAGLMFNAIDVGEMVTMFEELANPGIPIPPEAKATHHIQEKDLINCRPPADVLADFSHTMRDADYWVAHNAPYDRGIIGRVDPGYHSMKWIDTYRCAKAIWPNAPGYSNQVLRYWLELDVEVPPGLYPHRAMYDVIVTAWILREMLKSKTAEELYDISKKPILLEVCNLKKYKGVLWKNVPKDYLQWVVKQDFFDEDTRHTAMYYLRDQSSLL